MRIWPSSPLEVNSSSSLDGRRSLSVGSVQVADDVGVGVSIWGDESIAKIVWNGPSNNDWSCLQVLKGCGVTLVVDTIGDDTGNGTVSGSLGGKSNRTGDLGNLGEGHVDSWIGGTEKSGRKMRRICKSWYKSKIKLQSMKSK